MSALVYVCLLINRAFDICEQINKRVYVNRRCTIYYTCSALCTDKLVGDMKWTLYIHLFKLGALHAPISVEAIGRGTSAVPTGSRSHMQARGRGHTPRWRKQTTIVRSVTVH